MQIKLSWNLSLTEKFLDSKMNGAILISHHYWILLFVHSVFSFLRSFNKCLWILYASKPVLVVGICQWTNIQNLLCQEMCEGIWLFVANHQILWPLSNIWATAWLFKELYEGIINIQRTPHSPYVEFGELKHVQTSMISSPVRVIDRSNTSQTFLVLSCFVCCLCCCCCRNT